MQSCYLEPHHAEEGRRVLKSLSGAPLMVDGRKWLRRGIEARSMSLQRYFMCPVRGAWWGESATNDAGPGRSSSSTNGGSSEKRPESTAFRVPAGDIT